jgi:UDP-N-acetylglucosamine--N-acetylmuramyl-(pentapeptide) pyrophosphoryl-undecaprenol N-acetylglucosamine transferase
VVDKVCLNFLEAADYLKVKKNKIEITGNPVRPQILNVDLNKAYRELNLKPELKTILITGGSLGAEVINQNIVKLYKYAVQNNIQILHLSGRKNHSQLLADLKNNNLDPENPLLNIIAYLNEMEYALAAADLIIARAGATGLAEITSCAKASILIPFAAAAENHQLVNARSLQKNGAAIVIEEAELNQNILLKKAKMIIENEDKLNSMSAAAAKMSQKDSLANIIQVIEKLFCN